MKEKKKKQSTFKRLRAYSGKKDFMFVSAMLMSALSGILVLMPIIFIHKILRGLILNGQADSNAIMSNALYAAAFATAGLVLYLGAAMISHAYAFEVEHNIIKQSMNRLLNMPLGFFANRESGKLRKIIIDGAGQTHTFLAHQLPDFASTMISPVVLLVLFIAFDWKIGIASLIPALVGMYFMATMMSPSKKVLRDEYYAAMGDLSSEAVEYVRGIPVVKTFAQSIDSFEKFNSLIDKVYEMVMKMTLGWKNTMSFYEALATSTAFIIVPVAILLIRSGGNIREVAANSIIYMLIGPVFSIFLMRTAYIQQYMYFAELALDKIDEILKYENMSYGNSTVGEDTVEFKNVSFSYDNEKVLNNVSFKVEKGKTVALVGASGGGKTTIARLAARFYDVDEGEVLLGGVNIKEYEKFALMRKIAFVFQNSNLFKMSIKENLLLANPNATDSEIENALIKSGSKEITDKLEKGLDTVFGTKGTYFSGGEIQRLSIARAFLKDADIIILDEATAFSDPENEHIIQSSFKELAKDKTTLIIAHRLSTIVDADMILVFDGGKIAERGTHDELVAAGGAYSRLWEEYNKAAKWKIGGSHV